MGELPGAWGRGPSAGGDWSRGGGDGGGGGSSGGGDLSLSSLGLSPGQGGVADNNRAGNPTRRGKRCAQPGTSACRPSHTIPRAPLWPPEEGLQGLGQWTSRPLSVPPGNPR